MKNRLKVGLYINDPGATILHFVRCLRDWNMAFVSVWRDELRDIEPGAVDVLLLHGGWYGIDRVPGQNQDDRTERPENRPMADAVRRFVSEGGGVVGVCAGSFNVVWLGLIPARISRTAGTGPHSMEVVDGIHPILSGVAERAEGRTDRQWKAIPVIRVNGPIFFPAEPRHMILSYDWEHRLGAVLAAEYGKGRAVAISPHPERTEDEGASNPDAVKGAPLMPAAGILRNSLYWSAGWPAPQKP